MQPWLQQDWVHQSHSSSLPLETAVNGGGHTCSTQHSFLTCCLAVVAAWQYQELASPACWPGTPRMTL